MSIQNTHGVLAAPRIVLAIRELIAAIDRRVPRIERSDEIQIAEDAAAPRTEAVTRLGELGIAATPAPCYDQELVEAIMTDDGGPPRRDRRLEE